MLLHRHVPSAGFREASDSRIRRTEQAVQAVRLALPRREPYFCRRQISQKPMSGGKHRRNREAERQALRIQEATVSGMTCLAKKGRAPGLYRGKVLRFHGKSIHFPRKTGPEMQEEGSRAGFAGGKCIKNAIKWFTFRIGETGERTTQCSRCSPLALPDGRQACIGNEGAIYENCWSSRKLLNLHKIL